jgi:hypothetical protein
VSVPVQSSQRLATLVEAADQGRQANPLVAIIHTNDRRLTKLQSLITDLVFGDLNVGTATAQLIEILRAPS